MSLFNLHIFSFMRFRFISFLLFVVFVVAGCALDYNNYPYNNDVQESSVAEPSTTTTEPVVTDVPAADVVSESTSEPVSEDVSEPVVESAPVSEPVVVESQTKFFDVSGSQFSFTPNTLTVNKGDTVVINFSTTDVSHGFSLTEFNFSLAATTPGTVVTGSFVADQAGTFIFSCNASCGSGHSEMKGTLLVEEK